VVLALFILAAQGRAFAQPASCTLTGKMSIEGGEELPYRLTLEITGQQVKGVSVTTQEGKELKAKVKGLINKEKKVMVLSETGPIGKLSDSLEMCFFNSILKWKTKHGKYIMSGAFVGKDKKNNPCSQGKVVLEALIADCAALKEDTIAAAKDTVAAGDDQQVTEGRDKHIEWGSATCILEIWDFGIVDGDIVTIMVDGKEVLANYTLTAEKKRIYIAVSGKTTTITVLAVDEGLNSPNTSRVVLTDGDMQHSLTTYNKKGKKANIVLTKK